MTSSSCRVAVTLRLLGGLAEARRKPLESTSGLRSVLAPGPPAATLDLTPFRSELRNLPLRSVELDLVSPPVRKLDGDQDGFLLRDDLTR
jgi:hypothetical protein